MTVMIMTLRSQMTTGIRNSLYTEPTHFIQNGVQSYYVQVQIAFYKMRNQYILIKKGTIYTKTGDQIKTRIEYQWNQSYTRESYIRVSDAV